MDKGGLHRSLGLPEGQKHHRRARIPSSRKVCRDRGVIQTRACEERIGPFAKQVFEE